MLSPSSPEPAQHATEEEFDRLLAEQDGRCRICQAKFDDDHPARIDRAADGRVRGLLCARCKVGVSTFQDDVDPA
jgi:hypothetical protein